MEILFLGTGTSHGVPLIGCDCDTCLSRDSRNNRTRCSIFIKEKDISVLIDTPQELRLQLLDNNITHFDIILYTHPHADHLLGFDDIRSVNRLTGKKVPCYGNKYTINEIKRVFPYIHDAVQKGGGLPEVSFHIIDRTLSFSGIEIIPLPVKHGKLDILGYRIGKMAYITDCSFLPDDTYKLLDDIELLIIAALRYKKHKTHMNIEEVINVIKTLNVPRAYLTHMSHDLEYNRLNYQLPDHIKPAYDGLRIEI